MRTYVAVATVRRTSYKELYLPSTLATCCSLKEIFLTAVIASYYISITDWAASVSLTVIFMLPLHTKRAGKRTFLNGYIVMIRISVNSFKHETLDEFVLKSTKSFKFIVSWVLKFILNLVFCFEFNTSSSSYFNQFERCYLKCV